MNYFKLWIQIENNLFFLWGWKGRKGRLELVIFFLQRIQFKKKIDYFFFFLVGGGGGGGGSS